MILRYVSHIPQHHFKMVRYYGFLSNRKRGRLLPLVYLAIGKKSAKQGELLTYAKLYKGLTGNDPRCPAAMESQVMVRMMKAKNGRQIPSVFYCRLQDGAHRQLFKPFHSLSEVFFSTDIRVTRCTQSRHFSKFVPC